MNTFFQKSTLAFGLAASLSLVSCQDKDLVTPDHPAEAAKAATALDGGIVVGFPKKYTLTKHGQATLTYQADGRLKKVDYAGQVPAFYTIYTYALQTITTTTYTGNKVFNKVTYQLDNTGRCTTAKETDYMYYGPTPQNPYGSYSTTDINSTYQYNALGQLKTRFINNAGYQTDYVFNPAGDLSKITNYKNFVAAEEVTFAYDQPVGDPILADRYPINSTWTNLPDPYLKIFGKTSKHLVKLLTQKLLPTNQTLTNHYFAYTLNTDGYVTEAKEFNIANAALVATTGYEYLVTDITLMP